MFSKHQRDPKPFHVGSRAGPLSSLLIKHVVAWASTCLREGKKCCDGRKRFRNDIIAPIKLSMFVIRKFCRDFKLSMELCACVGLLSEAS